MLVLSRVVGEDIRIGDNIIIRVVSVRGERVRIGVDAPADVRVHRAEVYEAIEKANATTVEPGSD